MGVGRRSWVAVGAFVSSLGSLSGPVGSFLRGLSRWSWAALGASLGPSMFFHIQGQCGSKRFGLQHGPEQIEGMLLIRDPRNVLVLPALFMGIGSVALLNFVSCAHNGGKQHFSGDMLADGMYERSLVGSFHSERTLDNTILGKPGQLAISTKLRPVIQLGDKPGSDARPTKSSLASHRLHFRTKATQGRYMDAGIFGTNIKTEGLSKRNSKTVSNLLRYASTPSSQDSPSEDGLQAIPGYKTQKLTLEEGSGQEVKKGDMVVVDATGVVKETGQLIC